MIGALDEVHNGRGGDGLAGAAEAHHGGGDHHGNAEDFDAAAGDRLLIESDVPDFYFEAAATFRVLGPGGGELEWWFSFRTGEIEIPTDGLYTLPLARAPLMRRRRSQRLSNAGRPPGPRVRARSQLVLRNRSKPFSAFDAIDLVGPENGVARRASTV